MTIDERAEEIAYRLHLDLAGKALIANEITQAVEEAKLDTAIELGKAWTKVKNDAYEAAAQIAEAHEDPTPCGSAIAESIRSKIYK